MTIGRSLLFVAVTTLSAAVFADNAGIVTFDLGAYPFFNQGWLTNSGQLFYSFGRCDVGGCNVYVNHSPLTGVLSSSGEYLAFADFASGDMAYWWWRPSCSDAAPAHTCLSSVSALSTTEISNFPSDVTFSRVAKSTSAGTAWYGRRSSTGTNQDVYRDTTIMSDILGSSRTAFARDINVSGNVAWDGLGSATSFAWDAFLNKANYSRAMLTGTRRGGSIAVNSRGVLLWTGRGDNTNQKAHVYLSLLDYSVGIVGANYDAQGFYLNDSNDVLWAQYAPGNNVDDLWLNNQNLSIVAMQGDGRQAVPFGLSATHEALWTGSSNVTRIETAQDVFLNSINVSRAVLGPVRGTGQALAINDLGWAAWYLPTSDSTSNAYVTIRTTQTVQFQFSLDGWTGPAYPSTVLSITPTGTGWAPVNVPITMSTATSVQLPRGTFDITVVANHYLHKTLHGVDTTSGLVQSVSLAGGDATNDNKVDLEDLSTIVGSLGQSSPDLTGDGIVDLRDMALVLANFGLSGD